MTGIANLSPSQQSAAERAREGRGEEGEEAAGGDGPTRGRGVLEEQQRYSVIMDRYERLMERYHTLTNNRNRELDWPERGASRAVDQPELVAAAVREEGANRQANRGEAASPMRALTPEVPAVRGLPEGASRLLTDLAQVATHTSTSTQQPEQGPASEMEATSSGNATPPEPHASNYPSLNRPGLQPYPPSGPRYRRYSLLLDREDLDVRPRPRLSRGTRGREGARLRRVDTFREPGDDWASYRRELRERMLELRRLRDISRAETRSTARDIQPASSILDLQVYFTSDINTKYRGNVNENMLLNSILGLHHKCL